MPSLSHGLALRLVLKYVMLVVRTRPRHTCNIVLTWHTMAVVSRASTHLHIVRMVLSGSLSSFFRNGSVQTPEQLWSQDGQQHQPSASAPAPYLSIGVGGAAHSSAQDQRPDPHAGLMASLGICPASCLDAAHMLLSDCDHASGVL